MPGLYKSLLDNSFRPSPQEPHAYTLALPMPPSTPIPSFDLADGTGKFVKAIVIDREKVLSKNILAAGAYYRVEDVPTIFAEVKPESGKGAKFVTVDKGTYKGFLKAARMPEFA